MPGDDDGRDEGDLLGWRTGRRRWMRLDTGGDADNRGKGPKNYARADARILDDVCERLKDSDLDVREVEVTVKDGEVTFEGEVADRLTKRAIEDIAFTVRGVRDCHNRVRLATTTEDAAAGPPHTAVTRVGVPRS